MKRTIILIIYIILCYSVMCYASSGGSVELYFATGEKSQTDEIEDRDLSGDFDYYKCGFSSNLNLEKNISLKMGFDQYHKDFSSLNQSNADTDVYKIGADFLILDNKESSLNSGLDFSLRNKHYKSAPLSSYDQQRVDGAIKYKLKDIYSLDLNAGINNYEYINDYDNDTMKAFLKISPGVYLFDKALELSGFFRVQRLDAYGNNKDTTETMQGATTTLNLDTPCLNKIRAQFENGKENTQDTEDREDSLRYKYQKWNATTYHKFFEKLKNQVEYGQKRRVYLANDNDYENWYIKNKNTLLVIEKDPFDMELSADYEHKETTFDSQHTKSYISNKLGGGLSFSRRADWSFDPEFSFTGYDYTPGSTSTQKSYKAQIGAKKYISEDLILEGYYWHKWKDYKNKADAEQWTLNLSCAVRF
ncbi:MAG: hypothetical protein V2A72_06220 [Candidatus Omnitrophota bacterium]